MELLHQVPLREITYGTHLLHQDPLREIADGTLSGLQRLRATMAMALIESS